MDQLTQRSKVLIFSDKYGWETAAAYGTDHVASDSKDEKRIKKKLNVHEKRLRPSETKKPN